MAKRKKQKPPAAPESAAARAVPTREWTPRARWMARGLVALASLATFARGIPSPLVESWDDGRFLVDFEPVRSISLDHLVAIFSEPHFEAWHPLHLLSYWLDVPWAGPSGPVIHAVSAGLWILALWLALRVFERLGLSIVPALIAVLVYGLHPVQVEAVSWATGRKEILALAFSCLAWLAHLDAPRDVAWASAAGSARARIALRSALPALFYVLAAMSKTTVLPLPGVLFLADVLLRDVPARRALLRQLPMIAIGAAFAVAVVTIWQEHEMIRDGGAGLVAATFTHDVLTVIWPSALSPIYAIHRSGELGLRMWVLPAAYALALVLAWRLRARRALFALSATGVLLLPVLNIVPVYFQFQDRYLSLPLLPLAFGAGAAIDAAIARFGMRRAVPIAGLGAAIVIALAARTFDYERAWTSDLALWRHATSTHPDAFYAWLKLGEHLRDAGELDASVEAYARAIEAAPELQLGHAAYFNAVAMRDERRAHLPARSLSWTARYGAALDDADALRSIAGELADAGYRDAVTLALGRSLDIAPVEDARLAHAASVQLQRGNEWLARFYVSRMFAPPEDPALRALRE